MAHLRQCRSVWSIWSVRSFWLHDTNLLDQIDQTDQMNKTDRAPVFSQEPVRDSHADQKHGEHHQHRDQPPQMTMRLPGIVMPMNAPRKFKIVRMSDHHTLLPYETFTSIDFGFAFSDLGRCTFKTPSLYSALTLLPSASSGKVKLRMKLP